MKKRIFTTGIFIITLLLAINTQAQDKKGRKNGGSPEKLIERLDTNKDGQLNLEEVSQAKRGKLAENFETADTNNDGFLNAEEIKIYMEENRKKRTKKQ